MDQTDLRILRILQEDSSLAASDVAKKVGLSAQASDPHFCRPHAPTLDSNAGGRRSQHRAQRRDRPPLWQLFANERHAAGLPDSPV